MNARKVPCLYLQSMWKLRHQIFLSARWLKVALSHNLPDSINGDIHPAAVYVHKHGTYLCIVNFLLNPLSTHHLIWQFQSSLLGLGSGFEVQTFFFPLYFYISLVAWITNIQKRFWTLAGWLSWLEHHSRMLRCWVRPPVRTCARISQWMHHWAEQQVGVLTLSLPSSLSLKSINNLKNDFGVHQLEVFLTDSVSTTSFQGVGLMPTWLPWLREACP